MTKLQQIKLIVSAIICIERYKRLNPPGYEQLFVTPETVRIKEQEEKTIRRLTQHLLDLQGYIVFEFKTWKEVKPYKDENGHWQRTKYTKHRIKARSEAEAWNIRNRKFEKENGTEYVKIVG